jgi:hypothetical protein
MDLQLKTKNRGGYRGGGWVPSKGTKNHGVLGEAHPWLGLDQLEIENTMQSTGALTKQI